MAASSTNKTTLNQPISELNKTTTTEATKKSNDELGKDQFLQLLVTQLQHQDPLKPMDDTQFIGQMAQFSALEQMQNLNTSFTMTKAMNMVGKYATGILTDDDGSQEEISGEVQSVRMSSGKAYALVDGKEIPIDDITEVQNISESDIIDLNKYTQLIGKNVNSVVKGVKDDEVYKLQGKVYSVSMTADMPVAILDGIKAKVSSLILSSEEESKVTTVKEYLQNNIGKVVATTIIDSEGNKTHLSGEIAEVTGDDNNPEVVFNQVVTPMDSIYEIY